ncbi:MAG: alpha/beta fold hydrolase [Panacagrimonas sp.]
MSDARTPQRQQRLDSLREEIERNSRRARNGLKYLFGGRFVRTGATPRTVVWKHGKAELWHYAGKEASLGPPLLAFIGLVSRSYVLDLHAGNSYVERLINAGHAVYVLDWGVPDEADATNTLATYALDLLPRAVAALLRHAKAKEVILTGYCMGGCLALAAMGAGAEMPVRALVTMASPVDFSKVGSFVEPIRSRSIEPETLIDETGNLPASLVFRSFAIRHPTADLVQAANLWQNLWNDEYVVGYQAMNEWIADHIPMPGGVFRDIVRWWIQGNGFMSGNFQLGAHKVDLSRIRCPVLCVVAERDEIVPRASAAALPALLTGTRADVLSIPAGHISITCGRQAAKVAIPAILDWIRQHSEPRTT